MAMPVEVRQEAVSVPASEINSQNTPVDLQDPVDFAGARLPRLPRQMAKHQRAQHHIEVTVGKWQALGNAHSKVHINVCLRRLSTRPRDHRN
jgi:hypothetical protein